mmetsp:Transcript_76810/g.217349  ORF Transcript_76810/g.217349 Transcript_76810/m.217349 type:complete len:1008 (-) Transcript_76810:403-3426(-)
MGCNKSKHDIYDPKDDTRSTTYSMGPNKHKLCCYDRPGLCPSTDVIVKADTSGLQAGVLDDRYTVAVEPPLLLQHIERVVHPANVTPHRAIEASPMPSAVARASRPVARPLASDKRPSSCHLLASKAADESARTPAAKSWDLEGQGLEGTQPGPEPVPPEPRRPSAPEAPACHAADTDSTGMQGDAGGRLWPTEDERPPARLPKAIAPPPAGGRSRAKDNAGHKAGETVLPGQSQCLQPVAAEDAARSNASSKLPTVPAPLHEPSCSGAIAIEAGHALRPHSKPKPEPKSRVSAPEPTHHALDFAEKGTDESNVLPEEATKAGTPGLPENSSRSADQTLARDSRQPDLGKATKPSRQGHDGSASRRSDTAPPTRRSRRNAVVPSFLPPSACHDSSKPGKDDSSAALQSLDPDAHQEPLVESFIPTTGEPWEAFLNRVAPVVASTGGAPAKLFEAFRTTDDVAQAYAAFAHLFHVSTSSHKDDRPGAPGPVQPWAAAGSSGPPWQFPYEPIRVLLGGNWKAKQLWDKLDVRSARTDYADAPCACGRMAGRCAAVVGAGPSGLRAAIELRLLGARVTVIERRTEFSRINQLHLWSWCGDEIKALGARCLEPPSKDFGANPDLLHIGINELQTLLFKTALLLGVEMLLGTEFAGTEQQADGTWSIRLGRGGGCGPPSGACAHVPDSSSSSNSSSAVDVVLFGGTEAFAASLPSPAAPDELRRVAVLVGSDGLSCRVGRSMGLEIAESGSLRAEDAIGLVCNFAPLGGAAEERALRSFSLARQFYGPLFGELGKATGVELENIVYTKSKRSHYFVMTPTRRCLISSGVVRSASQKPMLAGDNVDRAALDAFVRRVVAFRFKPEEPTLAEVAGQATAGELHFADGGPQLFDFSKLRRAAEGITFVQQGDSGSLEGVTGGETMLVALAGDALLEPFWPEGLGIVRGFFSALDVSSTAAMWAAGASQEQVQQHFSAAFAQLKSLGAQTRTRVLRSEEKAFGLAPSTRYRAVGAG